MQEIKVLKISLHGPVDSNTRLFRCFVIGITDGHGPEVVLCKVDVAWSRKAAELKRTGASEVSKARSEERVWML